MDFQSDGRTLQVTLSIGASYNAGGSTLFFDAMLLAAEEALEASVEAGGDRYEVLAPGGSAV